MILPALARRPFARVSGTWEVAMLQITRYVALDAHKQYILAAAIGVYKQP
jgi:hypothetical protein